MRDQHSVYVKISTMIALVGMAVTLPASAMAETQTEAAHVTTHHALQPDRPTGKAASSRSARKPEADAPAKIVTPPAPVAVIKPRDVLCVAGCPDGATPPQLVQSGSKPLAVPMQVPSTSANVAEQHTTAIFCYNGGGCKSRGFYRPDPGRGYYDAEPQSHSHYPSRNSIYVIDR